MVKAIRKRWENEFGKEYAVYLNACERLRQELREKYPNDPAARQNIMRKIAALDLVEKYKGHNEDQILEILRTWISQHLA